MNTMRQATTAPAKPLDWLVYLILAIALGVAVLVAGEMALAAVISVIVFAAFVRYPIAGLYTTTVLLLLFSGQSGIIGGGDVVPITLAKLCGVAVLVAWAVHALAVKARARLGWPLLVLLAFLIWALTGTASGLERAEQWGEWVRLLTLVAFFAVTLQILDTPDKVRRYAILVAVCAFVMGCYAVAQYFIPAMHLPSDTALEQMAAGAEGAFVDAESLENGAAVRVTGRALHSNWLALALVVVMPLNVFWLLTAGSKRAKTLACAAIGIELVALVFTFTRTGFLVGCAVVIFLIAKGVIRITPHRVVFAAAAFILAFIFLLPEPYKERVFDVSQYERSESISYRAQLNAAAMEYLDEKPLRGQGLGGFGPRLLEDNSPIATHQRFYVEHMGWNPVFIGAHSLYLQLACETGFVGLALMLLFFVFLFRGIAHARRRFEAAGDERSVQLVRALNVSLWAFLLCGLFLHGLQQKVFWMVAAMAAALACCAPAANGADETAE